MSMGYGATVTIVNIEKRQVSSRYFRTISEAMSFLKSYPRYKGCPDSLEYQTFTLYG